MKILVTGGSGFIGRNLIPLLAASSSVDCVIAACRQRPPPLSAPNVSWIQADLGTPEWTSSLPEENVDVVIHLAQSRHYRDFPSQVRDIFNINVKATLELADWARTHGAKRFLFASTGNVYGFKGKVYAEEDACQPESMYGASKLAAEILLKPFSASMQISVLRLFGVYGPGQTGSMLSNLLERYRSGQEIVLAGNVGVRFNPIYIDDCTRIVVRLMEASETDEYDVMNIGGGETVDVRGIADLLGKIGGKKAVTRISSEEPKELVGSIDKLRRQKLCEPEIPFEEGLRRVFHHQFFS